MQSSLSIGSLLADLNGRVIAPDDAAYDEARTVFYGGFDRWPATAPHDGPRQDGEGRER